ncbi:MAG TPA: glycine zipper 2TM domain-containing protein [Micavibrio sp.]|nr:glycine zipper 2TM domain-containing protein [Micavibrio sp.]
MSKRQILAWGLGAVALVLLTAGASALITREVIESKKPAAESASVVAPATKQKITWNEPRRQAPPTPPPCNDGNIVGKVVGGLGGGLVGSQIGSGSGKTAATIGGAVGGTVLGGEYIPTENVTCR